MPGTNADVRGLGGFVWSIAEILRGDFKQSEYGKVAGVLSLQAFEREGAEVVDLDVLAGSGEQDHVPGRVIHGVGQPLGRFEDVPFGRIEEAIETAEHDERQNDNCTTT